MSWLFHPARATLLKEFAKSTPTSAARAFSTTTTLFAEPPRKRRRVDPVVLKVRVERKIVKTEKEIQRIESEPREPIPILEYQLNKTEIRDLQARPARKIEDVDGLNESTIRAAQRLWGFYRHAQTRMEQKSIRQVELSQTRALETLKNLDEALYNRTISVDEDTLIPYKSNHIRKETAPNSNYTRPDGYIKDVSKEWIM